MKKRLKLCYVALAGWLLLLPPAALAYVGWFLLLPPNRDFSVPLSQWRIAMSYPDPSPGLPLTADMLTGDGQQRCEAQNRAEVRMGLDPSHVGVCKKLNDAYFIILLDGTTVSSELGYKPDLK
jgi:UPF0716 family protein affecting phage T7 exclusion